MRVFRILAAGLAVSLLIVGGRWLLRAPDSEPPAVIVREGAPEKTPSGLQGPERAVSPGGATLLEVGDTVPDATLIDHLGRRFTVSELRGEILVLAFIYTHCNLPSMCPLTAGRFGEVKEILEEHGLTSVRLLLVSFDTERDDPGTLAAFARRFGLDRPGILLATGSEAEVGRLAGSLRTFYRETHPGEFDHNIVVSVIDRVGVLRAEFYGPDWESGQIIEKVREAETRSAL